MTRDVCGPQSPYSGRGGKARAMERDERGKWKWWRRSWGGGRREEESVGGGGWWETGEKWGERLKRGERSNGWCGWRRRELLLREHIRIRNRRRVVQTGSRGRPAVSCSCWQTNYKTTQNVGAAHIWQNIRRHTDTSFFFYPHPLLFPLLFSFLRTQPIRHHPPHLSPARHTPFPPTPPSPNTQTQWSETQ